MTTVLSKNPFPLIWTTVRCQTKYWAECLQFTRENKLQLLCRKLVETAQGKRGEKNTAGWCDKNTQN